MTKLCEARLVVWDISEGAVLGADDEVREAAEGMVLAADGEAREAAEAAQRIKRLTEGPTEKEKDETDVAEDGTARGTTQGIGGVAGESAAKVDCTEEVYIY